MNLLHASVMTRFLVESINDQYHRVIIEKEKKYPCRIVMKKISCWTKVQSLKREDTWTGRDVKGSFCQLKTK